jgi:hypothetical protein
MLLSTYLKYIHYCCLNFFIENGNNKEEEFRRGTISQFRSITLNGSFLFQYERLILWAILRTLEFRILLVLRREVHAPQY